MKQGLIFLAQLLSDLLPDLFFLQINLFPRFRLHPVKMLRFNFVHVHWSVML
jgi:hypothetical protein